MCRFVCLCISNTVWKSNWRFHGDLLWVHPQQKQKAVLKWESICRWIKHSINIFFWWIDAYRIWRREICYSKGTLFLMETLPGDHPHLLLPPWKESLLFSMAFTELTPAPWLCFKGQDVSTDNLGAHDLFLECMNTDKLSFFLWMWGYNFKNTVKIKHWSFREYVMFSLYILKSWSNSLMCFISL